jgi:hypothetical protein
MAVADLFGHERPPVDPGFVEIAGELRMETYDAIAIVAKDVAGISLNSSREPWTWLAKSEVKAIHRGRGTAVTVIIPDWLAKVKGLL